MGADRIDAEGAAHFRHIAYKKLICIERLMMGGAHQKTVSWFVLYVFFGLGRDPSASLKVEPLHLEFSSSKGPFGSAIWAYLGCV